MNTTAVASASDRPSLEQVLVACAGIAHLFVGFATTLAPAWFFQNIGTFAPYNRHYEGDLGAFQLGMGVGLLLAARDPARQRLLLAAVALGNLLHALNHAYDALISHAALDYWLRDTVPIFLFAVVLVILASGALGRAQRR